MDMEQHTSKLHHRDKNKRKQPWYSTMKKKQLYLQSDILAIGLRASLLKAWDVKDEMQFPRNKLPNNAALQPIAFTSKILTSTETCFSYKQREMLDILCGLEKFTTNALPHEVIQIMDHRLLVLIVKKDVSCLSHRLQRILLGIQQCNIGMLYKPWPQPFIKNWLSRHNNETNRQTNTEHLHQNKCNRIMYRHSRQHNWRIRIVTLEDGNLSTLAELIYHIWWSEKAEVPKELQPCWLFRDELAIIDEMASKEEIIYLYNCKTRHKNSYISIRWAYKSQGCWPMTQYIGSSCVLT